MKHLKIGNIAFWRHSGLGAKPFLAGKVRKIHRAQEYPGPGHVGTEEFVGYWHKPAFCLPPKQGRELEAWIEKLDAERRRQTQEVERRFASAVRKLLPKGVKF